MNIQVGPSLTINVEHTQNCSDMKCSEFQFTSTVLQSYEGSIFFKSSAFLLN